MPSRSRTTTATGDDGELGLLGRSRRRGDPADDLPFWRREPSWKKFLDPRHPLTRCGLGSLISIVPLVGPCIVSMGSYYFGCARGPKIRFGVVFGLLAIGGFVALKYLFRIEFTNTLDVVWPSYNPNGTKFFLGAYFALLSSVSVVYLISLYRYRGPEFRDDVPLNEIELHDRQRLETRTPPPAPVDDGNYAMRRERRQEDPATTDSGPEVEAPFRSGSHRSRAPSISVTIPSAPRPVHPSQPYSSDSEGSSSAVSPAPIPTIHRRTAGPSRASRS